jgi:hypothetical protein
MSQHSLANTKTADWRRMSARGPSEERMRCVEVERVEGGGAREAVAAGGFRKADCASLFEPSLSRAIGAAIVSVRIFGRENGLRIVSLDAVRASGVRMREGKRA